MLNATVENGRVCHLRAFAAADNSFPLDQMGPRQGCIAAITQHRLRVTASTLIIVTMNVFRETQSLTRCQIERYATFCSLFFAHYCTAIKEMG